MKNKIEDLRNHLFATLEDLRDPDTPMDLDRARAIAEVAQIIINSAKVECEYLKITGKESASGFFPDEKLRLKALPGVTNVRKDIQA